MSAIWLQIEMREREAFYKTGGSEIHRQWPECEMNKMMTIMVTNDKLFTWEMWLLDADAGLEAWLAESQPLPELHCDCREWNDLEVVRVRRPE